MRAAWASSSRRTATATTAPVALKVLKRQLSGDFIFQQRFKQEARAAAEVHDRHLVPILESAEADGRHYLAVGLRGRRLARPTGSRADGPLPRRGCRPRRHRGRDRARRPPRGRRHAPRHQAVERPLRQRRDRDADRLRPRERTGVHRPHPARAGDGNARLPRARADPREAGDAGNRHLCARLRRLRVRRRQRRRSATRASSRSGSPISTSRRPIPAPSGPSSRRASPPRS